MIELDAASVAEQAVLIGLISRSQAREAQNDSADGSAEALIRTVMRKGWLTSWQRDKLLKGEARGFFYGPYKVLFHIAEGSFARVYRGEHQDTGQPVAIKVLRKRFTTDPAAVARFTQEAEAGCELKHPNIVQIYEHGETDGLPFMAMEYVEGSNLRDFLKIRHQLDANEGLPIMLGLARGMNYSHNEGVTHRDIKGTNILISTRREAKLVDFGLATVADDRLAEFAHTRTVDYSALERTCGSHKGDWRSDIFFLGCVFYQMLTGVLPLPEVETSDSLAKMLKRSFGAIKPISEMRSAPPPELCRIIDKMMKIELNQRYQMFSEVVDDLEAYAGGSAAPEDGAESVVREKSMVELSDTELLANAFDAATLRRPKQVLCVESQNGIQDTFQKVLSRMGYEVLHVAKAERAVDRYREFTPDAVLFDADGQTGNVLEHYLSLQAKARGSGQALATVVLLGPKQDELRERLPKDDRVVVLCKPIKMKDVQDAIQKVLPIPT